MENISKIAKAGLIGMLHEIKNPLTSIKLCIELLESCDEASRETYCEMLKKNADEIESAIGQISNCITDSSFKVHFIVEDSFVNESL